MPKNHFEANFVYFSLNYLGRGHPQLGQVKELSLKANCQPISYKIHFKTGRSLKADINCGHGRFGGM